MSSEVPWEKQQEDLLANVAIVKRFLAEVKYYVHSYWPEMVQSHKQAETAADQLDKEITELGH